MRNATWVCFNCREAVRRVPWPQTVVPCPQCGQPCRNLGHKVRIPPKRQAKAWSELQQEVWRRAVVAQEREAQSRLERLRYLRDYIRQLRDRGPNETRDRRIRQLQKMIDEM
jgi:hypothetical protein